MSKRVVILDLGDTLVGYYRGEAFRPILAESLEAVGSRLRALGFDSFDRPSLEAAWAENHESPDFRVQPLEGRLERIFGVSFDRLSSAQREEVAEAFLGPIFAVARLYPDTLPALRALRARGLRLGIVSNTPWGSPSSPWRREVARHGLAELCDHVGFCVDCGWRKPAPQPFAAALAHFGVAKEDSLYVGDRPAWDVVGATAFGLDAVLIDREGEHADFAGPRITSLEELLSFV